MPTWLGLSVLAVFKGLSLRGYLTLAPIKPLIIAAGIQGSTKMPARQASTAGSAVGRGAGRGRGSGGAPGAAPRPAPPPPPPPPPECHLCGQPIDDTQVVQYFDEMGEMMDNLFLGHGLYSEADYIREEDRPAEMQCSDCGKPTCQDCLVFCNGRDCRHTYQLMGHREGYCEECAEGHLYECDVHHTDYCGEGAILFCAHCHSPVCDSCHFLFKHLGSAAHVVCGQCARECPACGFRLACGQCMQECKSCHTTCCDDCALECTGCGERFHCAVDNCAMCGCTLCSSCQQRGHQCKGVGVDDTAAAQQYPAGFSLDMGPPGTAWRARPNTSFWQAQHVLLPGSRALIFGAPVAAARAGGARSTSSSSYQDKYNVRYRSPQLLDLDTLQLSTVNTSGPAPASGLHSPTLLGHIAGRTFFLLPERTSSSPQGGRGSAGRGAGRSTGAGGERGRADSAVSGGATGRQLAVLEEGSWQWSTQHVQVPATLPTAGGWDSTCSVSVGTCIFMFSSSWCSTSSSSNSSWVHVLDTANQPLAIRAVAARGPQPSQSGSFGSQRHLAGTVLEDGRVLLLHSSHHTFFFDPATSTVTLGPQLPDPVSDLKVMPYRDRYDYTSIVGLTALGPDDAFALVSFSFRRPSQFLRLHLSSQRWFLCEGAACRTRRHCALIPAGRRLLVLGGVECNPDSSDSDKPAGAVFVLGALRQPPPRGLIRRPGRYPAERVQQLTAPVRYSLRQCGLRDAPPSWAQPGPGAGPADADTEYYDTDD